ncbi:hypothetical protein QUA35_00620 [Microcoleus sp. N9_B2]|uniref:hypothetical protein n=1 Tax=unclassified Microcoleus TaxID=2642155 RepID=UPI002FD49730
MAVKTQYLHSLDAQKPGFSTPDRSPSTENFREQTRFLRPEICEYLSQKSGKIELDLGKTESLTANIEIQLENMKIRRGY